MRTIKIKTSWLSFVILSILFCLPFVINSCNFFSGNSETKKTEEDKLLAEVKGNKLYSSDLQGLVAQGTSENDSTQLVERYINSWVKKQLLLLRAKTEVDIDEASIERKLLDYKYDLIAFQFEKEYIEQQLDTIVQSDDINDYFESNKNNFLLKEPIIKAILIVLPVNNSQKNEILTLIQSNNPQDLPKLKEYCVRFADTYHLNDSSWVELDNLILNTPFEQVATTNNLLVKYNFAEFSDQEFVYYLKTIDGKNTGETAPLDYISQTIKSMIINQRKVKLSQSLQQDIYEEAKKNNLFIIHK